VRPSVERVARTVGGAGDGLCLLCIDQLRDCREVYGVAAIAYCRPPECLGRSVILGWSKGHARGLSCLQCVEHEFLWLGCLRANERARLLRDVARDVAIDGDNEVGDTKELGAIREVFAGQEIPLISSTKSLSGHALGAAGSNEAIYSILMMQNDFACASANIRNLDEQAEGLPILRENREMKLNAVMSNSFGFGGTNATLIFSRVD